jgi:uncharacterized protein (TIGR00288 family)
MEVRKRNIALFVDGPNMVRKKDLGFGLEDIYEATKKYGDVKIAEVFVDKYATQKLIESVVNRGYRLGDIGIEDVDAPFASRATEVICSPEYDFIDTIALATKDGDLATVIHRAKNYNKETIVIGAEPRFSPALTRAADYVETIKKEGKSDSIDEETSKK